MLRQRVIVKATWKYVTYSNLLGQIILQKSPAVKCDIYYQNHHDREEHKYVFFHYVYNLGMLYLDKSMVKGALCLFSQNSDISS